MIAGRVCADNGEEMRRHHPLDDFGWRESESRRYRLAQIAGAVWAFCAIAIIVADIRLGRFNVLREAVLAIAALVGLSVVWLARVKRGSNG